MMNCLAISLFDRGSYLGITAHWLETETLKRKQVYLACRRIKGKHMHDVLSYELYQIYLEFAIQNTITFYRQ